MKKFLTFVFLSILLIVSMCGCSATETDYIDFEISYDSSAKTYTVKNIDSRDLYGIDLHVHGIKGKNSKCIDQKISSLLSGEERTFNIYEKDITDVKIERVSANTDPEWEVKSNKTGAYVGYTFLGIVIVIVIIIVVCVLVC